MSEARLAKRAPAPASLDATQERAFARRARLVGHDPDELADGGEVVTYATVASVAAIRQLSAATRAQRRRRQRVFFNPVVEARRRIGQGVHDRLEAAAFADGEIDGLDESRAARHFPFPTRALSVRHRRVGAGETWDLSVRGDRWGIADGDDILNVVNVGELVLEPGASVIVRGNLLVLVIQRLKCAARGAAAPSRIAVLPTPFPVDPGRVGPLHGRAGAAGRHGHDGAGGVPPPTQPSLLGPRLVAPVEAGSCDGRRGGDGSGGDRGDDGRTGGATKICEITIGELFGSLTVLAAGGRGGDGGGGGAGGDGGDGGDGAAGLRVVEGAIAPGRAGHGGHGGDGGDGGRGGHGGICSNVFVAVPPGAESRVRVLAPPAGGGRGGKGGAGGAAGRPGRTGDARGRGDRPGSAGAAGRLGNDGRARPAAPVFVNERRVH